jgi:ABC-2 type transport system ATP-binding protein
MSQAVLDVRDLRKYYGQVRAADGVSFTVTRGEIFGLIGPNGAGKTTTIECLVGLRDPDGGEIAICGIDARTRPREVKRRVGAALQTTALQDKVTPREALTLFGALYGKRVSIDDLVERFGLGEIADRPFDALSGGQQQRLALALAFVNDPELVILDEPTAGLDAQSRRDLRAEIAGMRRDDRTVLLTTHDIEEVEMLCDRIAIIDRGRIVATGTPAELIARSTAVPSVIVATTPKGVPGWLDGLPDADGVTYDGATVRLRTRDLPATLASVLARASAGGLTIAELHVQKATLEDVLIELTRHDRQA